MAEQPKSGFYIAVALVVLALIGFAVYRSDLVAPKPVPPGGAGEAQPKFDLKEVAQPVESSQDTASPTTVKEYRFKPAEKLPPVKGTAAYKPLENNTVQFALNVWAGWDHRRRSTTDNRAVRRESLPCPMASSAFTGSTWERPTRRSRMSMSTESPS